MALNRLLTGILFLGLLNGIFAQKGKDAARTVSVTNVRVNEFTALTSPAAINDRTITVAANGLNTNARFTSTLTPGDLVMIIQMQGALMNLGTYATPWQPDSTYGKVYDYRTAGNYEFAEVKSVISTNQIELTCGLKFAYSSSGKTQVVRVPRYTALTVTGAGTLTTDAWNGTIGGVLAVEVSGNTIIDGLVSASGLGFRGGVAIGNGGSGNSNFVTRNPNDGAEKGEGIGSDRLNNALAIDSLGKQCKGAPANGGGGGNANNCGGGGGGNGGNIFNYKGLGISNLTFSSTFDLEYPGRSSITSSGGGKGGYGTSTTTSVSANSVGPHTTLWGSFKRPAYGGFGGRPLDYSTGKIFMGGGGGAGHMSSGQSNGANACSGGAGGGLIYFLNYGTISGAGSISSNGANGNNAFGSSTFSNPTQGIDGAGGAGAGGTIILQSNGAISSITANANGGNGGNQVKSGTSNSEGQGPGGGGSGGYIAATNAGFTQNANGGAYGTTNASAFDTEFPMNGATSGDVGSINQSVAPSFSLTASANQTICTNQSTTLTASSTNTSAAIEWFNSATGGTLLYSGTTYTTPVYGSAGTYTVYAGSCPGLYRIPVIITVTNGPTFSINSPTICSGQTTVLTVTTSASTYTWSTAGSPTTSTISVSPSSTTIYTINGSSSSCVGSYTTQVTVNNAPTISVPNATICAGTSTILTASGTATSFTWMPGNITTSTVSASSNTTYTITGSNGTCTNSAIATVTVVALPTVSVSNATICAGTSTVLVASGTATSFTWMPGSITTSTISANSNSTYTITGSNGTCTNTTTATVTVIALPTVSVPSATICAGASTVLTASGTSASYTWMPGSVNTSTISANSNTTYTITGSNGTCTNSATATVTVVALPTVSVPSATICSGTSTVLTASGTATSFTWMPGSTTTSTISVSTASNYTVTGSNGTCTNSTTSNVSVNPTPTLTANNATICAGQVATFTVSGASSYTWNPGGTTGATFTISPASSGTISVTGANGTCSSQITRLVTVTSNPTVAVSHQTICPTQTVILTASGAATYSWNTGQTTNSISVAPSSTTIYTVTGTSSLCSNTQTVSVTVGSQPTVAVANASICSGNSTTLTASGATSYTWMPGGQVTSTVSVNPGSTTIYTITGSNGTCSATTTATVDVTATPTLVANSATICPSQTATLTVGGAASYTWNPGNISGNTYTISPASNTVVTIDGANGTCTAQTTVSVTIGTGISIAVNNPTICAGETASLTASGATSYTWDTGTNTNTLNVSPSSTQVYTVSGMSGTCSGSNTAIVTVNSVPSVSVTSASICSGTSTSLTASGATNYTWMPGGQLTPGITDNPSSTTIYTVTGANGTCSNTATGTISVTSSPTVVVSSASICSAQSATLTASGATNYTWMPGGQLTSGITDSPSSTTIYTVTGANGTCTNSATGTISVTPTPTLSVNSATICAGQTATLIVSGAVTYTWNPGSATSPTVTVTPTVNTTYTITGSDGACTSSVMSDVTVINCNSVCSFDLGNDTSFCSPMNYTINGPSGFTSYSWTPGGATTQNITATNTGTYVCTGTLLSNDLVANGDFSLGNTMFASNYVVPVVPGPFGLLSNPGTYIITTNPNSGHTNFMNFGDHTTGTGNMMVCNGSAVPNDIVWTETITVSPNTNYNFSAWVASVYNTTAGNEAQLQFSINNGLLGSVYSAPFIGGVWGNFSVNWNSGANNSAVITIVDQNFTAPGANDFALDDIFYQQVCSYSDTIVVTENQTPTVTVSATNSVICMGNSTSLTANGASTYTWTGGITNGSGFSPTVTATYSVVGTSVEGCTNTAVQTITVNSTPTISVNSPTICSGLTATITASGANTYTWSGNTNGTSLTVSPSTTTVYTVSGTDVNGCTSSAAASSTVNVTATPTISVNSPTICGGQTATITATGATSFTWSTTETTFSIITSPALTATYTVTGDNGGGCPSTLTSTVSVTPSPTITSSSASLGGCAPFCTNFFDVVSSSATGIVYTFGDGGTANTNNPSHCFTTGGTYTVTATVTNSVLGCSGSFTLPVITVSSRAVADFNITEGNVVTVGSDVNFINTSSNSTIYLWNFACTGQTATTTNFMTAFADTGNCCISLIADNISGCPDTVVKCINIVKEAVVVIPNVFTPNGDDSNDFFKIPSSGLKSLNCVIYDRWGLKMHEWDGLNGYWDGNAKSGEAPSGTYFYIINYTDQLENSTTEKGFLNLFRD